MRGIFYEPSSGKIIQRIAGSDATIIRLAQRKGWGFLATEEDLPYEATHRVVDGALTPKEESDADPDPE